MDEVYFSSTTSCLYCPPKDLDECVQGEIKDALLAAAEIGVKAHALYWVVPDAHLSGISIEQAMWEIAYEGFKIHPRAQKWDLDDERIHSLAEEIFSYAEKRGKMILIHCDEVSVEIAKTFFHLYLEKYKDRIKVLEEYIKLAFEEVEEA